MNSEKWVAAYSAHWSHRLSAVTSPRAAVEIVYSDLRRHTRNQPWRVRRALRHAVYRRVLELIADKREFEHAPS